MTPDRRRSNRAGDLRRRRLLDIATEQFGRHGYAGTSIAGVARAAEISDAGLLHHFPSKVALYAAVVSARTEAFAASFGEPRDLDAVFAGLKAGVAASLRDPARLRLQAMLSGEMLIEGHPLRDEYLDSQRRTLDALSGLLARFVGPDSAADPQQLALEILAVLKGLRAEWAAMPDRVDLASASATALDRIRDSLRVAVD